MPTLDDFELMTRLAWDTGRGGYFIHTQWEVLTENPNGSVREQIFFKNLLKNDGTMVFLGNYNQGNTVRSVRASDIAHRQVSLVLGFSRPMLSVLHANPGRKMTPAEVRAKWVCSTDMTGFGGTRTRDEGDFEGQGRIRLPLVRIVRNDVVNEVTKLALRNFIDIRNENHMKEALATFLMETPNGGSTRLFLGLQNLKADNIRVIPRVILEDGLPDHSKGYDIVLTCSPLK